MLVGSPVRSNYSFLKFAILGDLAFEKLIGPGASDPSAKTWLLVYLWILSDIPIRDRDYAGVLSRSCTSWLLQLSTFTSDYSFFKISSIILRRIGIYSLDPV